MNEYFQTLKDINQSIEQLLAHEYNFVKSVEIQESAKHLKSSIKPCLEELKSSAIRLEKLIKICLESLDDSEDVWKSKQRIAKASQAEIWEQLSDFTSCHFRIKSVGEEYKKNIIETTERLLEEAIEKIRQDNFIDPKTKQQRVGLGWGDKETLTQKMLALFENYSKKVDLIIIEVLNSLYSELYIILPSKIKIYSCFQLFDKYTNSRLKLKLESLHQILYDNYHRDVEELEKIKNGYTSKVISIVISDIAEWKNRFGGHDVSWEEIIKFKQKVREKTQERVNLIFDDRIVLTSNTLEEGIKFYNNLLEQQARYQQETSEEQLSEKAWIDEQRQALEKIQIKLKEIIK